MYVQNKGSDPANSHQENNVAETKALKKTIALQERRMQELETSIGAYTLRLHSFNRVLDQRDEEMRVDKIIMEQQTDVHLEKLKELAPVKIELETHKSELQSVKSELEAVKTDLEKNKAFIRDLKLKLKLEEDANRTFRSKLEFTERKLASTGHWSKPQEYDTTRLMQECEEVAAKEGTDSDLYKRKRKLLGKALRIAYQASLKANPPPSAGGSTS